MKYRSVFSTTNSVGQLASVGRSPCSAFLRFLSVEGTHKAGYGSTGLSWLKTSGHRAGAPAPHTHLSRSRGPLAPPGSRLCTHHAPPVHPARTRSAAPLSGLLRKISVLLATLVGGPRLCPGANLRWARHFRKSRRILTLLSLQRHHAFLRTRLIPTSASAANLTDVPDRFEAE